MTQKDWINIKDKQPDNFAPVLTYSEAGRCVAYKYVENGLSVWRIGSTDVILDCGITHWMPLPEPPQPNVL